LRPLIHTQRHATSNHKCYICNTLPVHFILVHVIDITLQLGFIQVYRSHNSHTGRLNLNPSLSGERPATRRLSHSTVLYIHIFITEYNKQCARFFLCINSRFQYERSFRPPYFQPSIPVSNILSDSSYMIFVYVINRHITWS